jgi:BirA family transcriptional regulator, biotin operon repressor / biotin---[acetyl-CoA-carboxylase] ligase
VIDIHRIRREFSGRRIDYHATIDSTMLAAARTPLGTIVLAEEQTAGQGRQGRSWHSAAGEGIYCSVVMQPAPVLTLALGLAAVDAIAGVTGVTCDLRWPNDVMLGSRKVAGILVQLVEGRAVAGIGVNVNQEAFPEDLAELATSLRMWTGREVCSTDLLIALLRAVDSFAHDRKDDVLRLFTHGSSYAAGRRVTVDLPDGAIVGTTAGLDESGFLIVRRDDGTDTLVLAGGVRATGT